MTNLRLLDPFGGLPTDSNLYGIYTVFLFRLDLSDLASVELNHRAGDQGAPLVPKVCAAHLETHGTCASGGTTGRLGWSNIKLLVYLFFEAFEARHLVCFAILISASEFFVVQAVRKLFCLCKVRSTQSLKLGY